MAGLGVMTVVYVSERLRMLIKEILDRNQIHFVELQHFDRELETLAALDFSSHPRTVVIVHPNSNDDVVRMVTVMCDLLKANTSILLISEDEHHHPVITSITGSSCLVLSPDVTPQRMEDELLRAFDQGPSATTKLERTAAQDHVLDCCKKLSASELEVLCYILEGGMNRAIANKLDISERTVENRRRKIFETFGSHSVAVVTRMISETIGCDEVFKMRDNSC